MAQARTSRSHEKTSEKVKKEQELLQALLWKKCLPPAGGEPASWLFLEGGK